MNAHLKFRTLRHAQAVALQFSAYAAPIESIAKFVHLSMGDDAPDMPDLVHFLRKEDTQKLLAAEYEVGLWRGPGGQYRLVSLTTPPTLEAIEYRLTSYPDSTGTQCAWCLINERNHFASELIQVRNVHGVPIHRRLVHKQCHKPFMAMVTQAARAGSVSYE